MSLSCRPYFADGLCLGSHKIPSRLILGTARYPSQQMMLKSLRASGSKLATVSLRRMTPNTNQQDIFSILKKEGVQVLPNTAGCYTVKEAVYTAELAREALQTNLIKLEVIADEYTLYPDAEKLLQAARELNRLKFEVLPYCIDDPITCQKLAEIGCAAVMPLGAPIGSGMGILNPYNISLICQRLSCPVIIDAGIGTASDVAQAMELGCDGVLIDTAIAEAEDPPGMARAMALACEAGFYAHHAGRIPPRQSAQSSSPSEGMIGETIPASIKRQSKKN